MREPDPVMGCPVSVTLPSAIAEREFLFAGTGALAAPREVGGELPISSTEYRLNDRIRASQCRLIGFDGSQLGIFAVSEALRIADEQGFDLVEIAPTADPPVCKIMDFGKFKYEQSMKEKAARKNQSKIELKEMKFRPKVDKHDYETKKKHILRFLDAGAKVKVTIMFRGREMAHPELGLAHAARSSEEEGDQGADDR